MLEKLEWWAMIQDYNSTIFPLQLIVMAIGIVLAGIYVFGKSKKISVAIKAYFALCNLWIGIMFFWVLGTELSSPARQIQGTLFIVIGMLFAVDIFAKKINFTIPQKSIKGVRKSITIVLLSIVMLYPVIGLLLGRSADSLIYPGTLPCATTAFALVLLSASLPKTNKVLFILLLVWAIPFPPLVQIPKYQVYEDTIMFGIGLYSLVCFILSLLNNKKIKVLRMQHNVQ